MTGKLRALIVLIVVFGPAHLANAMPPDPSAKVPWFPAALTGGPIYALSVSPSTSLGQFVAAGGEEVFTAGRGAVWTPAKAQVGIVSSLVTAADGTIFAATAATGLGHKSTDYGRSWQDVRFRGDAPVHFLATSPYFKQDGVAFGITRDDWRAYRNDRGNSNWIEVVYISDVPHQTGGIALSPVVQADETIFAGTDRGIYKSTDKGQTWTLISTPSDGAPAFGAAAGTPDSQGLVLPFDYGDDPYRQTDPDVRTVFAYNAAGVYRSDDDGQKWRKLSLSVPRVRGLAVSNGFPADPVLIAAVEGGGQVAAVSENGGDTWTPVMGPNGIAGTSVAMALDFAPTPAERKLGWSYIFLPMVLKAVNLINIPVPPLHAVDRGSREAYLGTDGDGTWRSKDGGHTWERQWTGLTNVQPTSVAFLPGGADANVLAGSRAAGLYRSVNGGRTYNWQPSGLPQGIDQVINGLAISPAFASDRTVYLAATSGVWVSHDGGVVWARTPGPTPAMNVSISPSFAQDHTLIASDQLSTDGGQVWSPLPVVNGPVTFSPTYSTDTTLWAGGTLLRRSVDGGKTWEDFQSVSALKDRPVYSVDDISVISGEYHVFAGTDRGLVQSMDNGKTWTRQGSVPSKSVYDLASQVLTSPQTALVTATTDDGVSWSTNRGVAWGSTPASPKPAGAVTVASDASAILATVPLRVARYGECSVCIYLPNAQQSRR